MSFYIDESGSITHSKQEHKRYFIIALVETNNPSKVKRVFRRAKTNFLKRHHGSRYDDLPRNNREIKGSRMPIKMKHYIFTQLSNKTDIKMRYIIIDNFHLNKNMLNDVELCFNFVLCEFYKQMYSSNNNNRKLSLHIDERNCAVESLNTLGNYLKMELEFNDYIDEFKECKYVDSEMSDLVQVADMVANTVHRACQDKKCSSANQEIVKQFCVHGNMYFPYRYNKLNFFDNDIYKLTV